MICMKRIMRGTKGYSKLTLNVIYFDYIWFSVMKTSKEDIAEEVYSFRPVNMNHKGFCLAKLEKSTK